MWNDQNVKRRIFLHESFCSDSARCAVYRKNPFIRSMEKLFNFCARMPFSAFADRAHPVVRQFFKAEVRVTVHIAAHGADKAFTAALVKRAFRRHIGRRADRRQTVHFTAVEIIRHRRADGAVTARAMISAAKTISCPTSMRDALHKTNSRCSRFTTGTPSMSTFVADVFSACLHFYR